MTKAEIITKFELFMDDQSDLSSQDESDLFDKIYEEFCMDHTWEALKAPFTGTVPAVGANMTVSLPTNFLYPVQNRNHTEDSYQAHGPVLFVIIGTAYNPMRIVSWSDRRQYVNRSDVVFIDIANKNLVFPNVPTQYAGMQFEMDYYALPTPLTDEQTPFFPFNHDILYHLMCVDEYILTQSDKAKSYAPDNNARANTMMGRLQLWNANLVQLT